MLRPGVTQEWVGEGELPKGRIHSEVVEALQCLNCFSAHIRLRESEGLSYPMLVVKGTEEVENAKTNLQILSQGKRAEAKELHKTDVNGLLIKIAIGDLRDKQMKIPEMPFSGIKYYFGIITKMPRRATKRNFINASSNLHTRNEPRRVYYDVTNIFSNITHL
ncbi:hypothetical protein B296_00024883 [Ensete ventricosum]|uniref:Uncharacterized protein n=1 Tax=Ensete ventricosum TaxID=4639 RepID=A0A426ZVC7_ENSVE|nr:hypothetical protein B296_00024883 [Ensete ventricosum]